VLASDNARAPAVVAFRGARTAPYFATAIAFYPGCGAYAHPDAYDPAAPLSIFIGADDDWTPAAPCVALGAAAAARGLPLAVTVYPASWHDFDDPAGTRQVLADIPNGHRAGGGVTIAPNPDARADAYAAVRSLLRTAIGPPPVPDHRGPRVHYFTP
jgi:dienelactone hydrolase